MRVPAAALCSFFALSCASSTPPPTTETSRADTSVRASAYLTDDTLLVATRDSDDRCALERLSSDGTKRLPTLAVGGCTAAIIPFAEASGGALVRASGNAAWLVGDRLRAAKSVETAIGRRSFVARQGQHLVWHRGSAAVSLPASLVLPKICRTDEFIAGVDRTAAGDALVLIGSDGNRRPLFSTSANGLDSFDIDPKGKEVVFSARREDGFDVGVVSSEGGEPRWIAPDVLDERMVRWAPRGNKISYVMQTSGGAAIRTVHLPTSYQLTASLPFARVVDVQWEPRAERYVVIASEPARAPYALTMKYSGEDRRKLVDGRELKVDVDQVPGTSALMLLPQQVRYGTRYPVAVLIGDGDRFAWDENAAAIAEKAVITVRAEGLSDSELQKTIEGIATLPFADPSRLVLVSAAQHAESHAGRRVIAAGVSPARTALEVEAALRR